MTAGVFITFEGGEGAGKSTQARRLADRLKASGREVVVTREPGGAPGAERIRKLLVNGPAERWSPLAEALLFSAARDEHLRHTIRPALMRGAVVICDRFADSTRAYQGAAGGVSRDLIERLEAAVVAEARPDLTIVLDIDPGRGLARAGLRGGADDRFEAKALAFHERLRQAFLDIAAAEPKRCMVIDGSGNATEVEAAIWSAVEPRLAALTGRVARS